MVVLYWVVPKVIVTHRVKHYLEQPGFLPDSSTVRKPDPIEFSYPVTARSPNPYAWVATPILHFLFGFLLLLRGLLNLFKLCRCNLLLELIDLLLNILQFLGCGWNLLIDHRVDLLEVLNFFFDLIKSLVFVCFEPLCVDLLLILQLRQRAAKPVRASPLNWRQLLYFLLQVLSALDIILQPSRFTLFLFL